MLLPLHISFNTPQPYIAGVADGIVTVNGKPSSRPIFLFDALSMQLLRRVASLPSGHYIFNGLDASKQYIVMCRDHKKEYEPVCWDYVTPAIDLTIEQQQELWQSWQTA